DLNKIPIVNDTNEMNNATSICQSNALANRLKGTILLQVQKNGEAWYIYPKTCRRIYLKDGEAAYSIMRFLGLGITNQNLDLIPAGQQINIIDNDNNNNSEPEYLVTYVTDGDTIHVDINGTDEKIRLLGIDAPELSGSECFATNAKNKLTELINNKKVSLMPDSQSADRDKYNRLLRYVILDSTDINAEMIKQGYAKAYLNFAFDKAEQYADYEMQAQNNNYGMWTENACSVANDFTDLGISYIFYDGIVSNKEPDEYVVVTNNSLNEINLNGYTLNDESGKTYNFKNITLPANSLIKIYTGCGTDTATELYWCYTYSAIWNNSGDTATLKNNLGSIIDTYSY
ncbi:MAG: hypothetical protein GF365_03970, partial [Candidatus Buchananbacteria bacterium]|nr:hypothetical protein [Candidatus Buchananbacteria bacterium]